jgi:hypothetical protein
MKLHTVARILVVDDDPVWLGIVSTAMANAPVDAQLELSL